MIDLDSISALMKSACSASGYLVLLVQWHVILCHLVLRWLE